MLFWVVSRPGSMVSKVTNDHYYSWNGTCSTIGTNGFFNRSTIGNDDSDGCQPVQWTNALVQHAMVTIYQTMKCWYFVLKQSNFSGCCEVPTVVSIYRGCAAVGLHKSMLVAAWQPAPEGLAQILQLLRVSSNKGWDCCCHWMLLTPQYGLA